MQAPQEVKNSLSAKCDAQISALDSAIATQDQMYGPESGWADSFCMPYCN